MEAPTTDCSSLTEYRHAQKSGKKTRLENLLILVHPGSLCGSADFNLGRPDAHLAREAVIDELNAWTGDILVLDGFLSDELPQYPRLCQAIIDAVARAPRLGERLDADDPDHARIALAFLIERSLALDTRIAITGAWYCPQNTSGCVN